MSLFTDKFPREMGIPRRIATVENIDEFKEFVDEHLHSKNLYTTIYAFSETQHGKPIYKSAIVEHMYFDFDPEPTGEWFEDAKRFVDFLMNRNMKHTIVFSGGGIHVYVKTLNHHPDGENALTNPKVALSNAQRKLMNMAGLEYVDEAVIGDIARISRIPNTYNHKDKRQKWCIPLTVDDLDEGLEYIRDEASKQGGKSDKERKVVWNGDAVVDLSKYDGGSKIRTSQGEIKTSEDFHPNMGMSHENVDWSHAPCLKQALESGEPNYNERFAILLYLKELGVSYNSAVDCLKEYLTPEKFDHAMDESGAGGTPRYIYMKDYLFPRKRKRIKQGVCTEDCKCDARAFLYETSLAAPQKDPRKGEKPKDSGDVIKLI